MENISVFLFFGIVLVIATILATAIGYFWASSSAKSDLLKQQKEQSETIYTKAQEQLQKWKEQELIPIRSSTNTGKCTWRSDKRSSRTTC
jgi:type II secretory pathway pseudopilin PulG